MLANPRRCGYRHTLLGQASLAALVATSATPAVAAGPVFRTLSQALSARASAYTTAVGGSMAATAAGQQAALGIRNLQAAAARFRTLQATLAVDAAAGAGAAGGAVPNGLISGGLVPQAGYATPGSSVWQGVSATAPLTQSVAGGTTIVTVDQAAPKAILNWTSFNIGAHTKLVFDQSAGGAGASGWTVLNRVNDPTAAPSQIFGAISAPGQVLILNRNGVLFGAGAQVSLHSLIAGSATLADSAFLGAGFIAPADATVAAPIFTQANGPVTVAAGAVIATDAPTSPTEGGGSVILLGRNVENDGLISTPSGQTILAAGRNFVLRAGHSAPPGSATPAPGTCPTESDCSTVLGTEIEAIGPGNATNTGLIVASTGDITMVGQSILQSGGLYATTAVNQRGTVHLLSDVTTIGTTTLLDPRATITLATAGVIAITPDANSATASDGQRRDAAETAYGGQNTLPDQAPLPDQPDRSRIEITTAGTVVFAPDALALATGGQIAISAGAGANMAGEPPDSGRVFLSSSAMLDVSGLNNVLLPMAANEITVSVQGFQLRDAPLNRDSGDLFNSTITLDARTLAYVAPNTVDGQARDYTKGGLFEVSAELAQQQRTIDEWSAVGGTVTLAGASVVAQPGAMVNIAGGSLAYQSGFLRQSYLIGPGGVLYNANSAPANLLYTGIYNGFVIDHARWQTIERYINPLIDPTEIYQPGYRIGRDAGGLALETPTALFEGTIAGGVETDPFQIAARNGRATDPVLLPQGVVPLAGMLSLRGAPSSSGSLTVSPTDVVIAAATPTLAVALAPGDRLPHGAADTATFGAAQLSGLGGIDLAVGPSSPNGAKNAGSITVDGAVTLSPGGLIALAAPSIAIDADLTARSGAVTLETENPVTNLGTLQAFSSLERGTLAIGAGIVIDTRGEFENATIGSPAPSTAAYVNGGNVTLLSDGALTTGAGSLIDASSGAVFNGTLTGGIGGNIALVADDPTLVNAFTGEGAELAPVLLAGELRSLGATAGGTVSITAPSILIGNNPAPATTLQVALPASFFASGFSDYVLNGFATPNPSPKAPPPGTAQGVIIAPGTELELQEPVLTIGPATQNAPTGTDPEAALSETLLPDFVLDPSLATLRQRPGASLTLSATLGIPGNAAFLFPQPGGGITIGQGASINADLGQSVTLTSPSQITVDGTIRAPSGTIAIENPANDANGIDPVKFGRSIWIGAGAVLDVSGEAVTGTSTNGRPFGLVTAGGTILLGASGDVNAIDNFASAAAYVFVRPGAELLANGASGVIDPFAGTVAPADPLNVASGGGTIAIASDFGIYLDGTMSAASGGATALGGELAIRLGDPGYGAVNGTTIYPDWAFTPHQILVSQQTTPTMLPADLAPGDWRFAQQNGANGQAAISAAQVTAGGFADLYLLARDQITFDGNVSLATAGSITLADFATSETSRSASVQLASPYVLLAGAPQPYLGNAEASPLLTYSPGSGVGAANGGQPFSKIEPCISGKATCNNSSLTISADLIDIESSATNIYGANALLNGVTFNGAYATFANEQAARPLDAAGFNDVTLASAGDIRFVAAPATPAPLAGSGANGLTLLPDALVTEGNLTLDAAQIYPVTGVQAAIGAGVNYWKLTDRRQGRLAANGLYYGGVLTLGRTTQNAPAPPLSVFARIDFQAATIEQGGIVEAPLGVIGFGRGSEFTANIGVSNAQVGTVQLLPGSVTSVSANGLTVPFGGTTDGTSYSYDGQALAPVAASLGLIGNQSATVFFTADRVAGAPGSVLDLSGGGTLTGGGGELLSGGTTLVSQGFIPGRGGSADTLVAPFLSSNNGSIVQPTIATDPIYAILPGYASSYAPTTAYDTSLSYYGSEPAIGQQITVGNALPGLPAGTYTLLPSYYALLPGAFRVQLDNPGAVAGSLTAPAAATTAIGPGTVAETVTLGTANSTGRSYPVLADFTTSAAVRDYSTYDEEGFASFAVQNAALFGNARPFLPVDAGDLILTLTAPMEQAKKNGRPRPPQPLPVGFTFAGTTQDQAATSGYGAIVVVQPAAGGNLEILGPGDLAQRGAVSADAAGLDALNPAALILGDGFQHFTTGSPTAPFAGAASTVTIDVGALLRADTIAVIAAKDVAIDAGATLSTLGETALLPNSNSGELFSNGADALVLLSNQNFLVTPSSTGKATIDIGGGAGGNALLAAREIVGLFTPQNLTVGANVTFGAPTLTLGSGTITLEGADAGASQANGLVLTQAKIDALLAGGQGAGVPAVQSLELDAGAGLALAGNVSLDLSASAANTLVLATPAILGLGGAADTATIRDGTVVWTGVPGATPGVPVAGAPGTGVGQLAIEADRLVLGYAANAQSQNQTALSDTVLGFAGVALDGAVSVSANNRSTLTVYQSETSNGTSTTGTGGDLTLATPQLTTAPGAVLGITAGGAVALAGNGTAAGSAGGLGGEIDIAASSFTDSSTVSLPSGRFAVTTSGNISLASGAAIDLAGSAVNIFTASRGSNGGTALLTSTGGAIDLAAGSRIDVSSSDAPSGTIGIVAPTGAVTLGGALLGAGSSPALSASIGITGTTLGDFAALNGALDAGGFERARSFEQTGPGDLTVTGTITAETLAIAVDQGSLTIDGMLDASGLTPGSIRLAATGNLTLGASAVLDAHETALHTDYFGTLIAAENVPHVELSVASNAANPGTLTLSPGASILMAGPGGLALGDLELDVPRSADNANANIAAGSPVNVTGAGTIAVNAFRTYTPGQTVAGDTLTGTLTQTDLNAIATESQAFIANTVTNGGLAGPLATELAGLARPYASVFHLRPGVEIDSNAASGNDLTVSGEIDLSEYRYASVNPSSQLNQSVYGSGEPGVLWLRAADNLTVAGSLTDGFLPTGAITLTVGRGKHRHTETLTSASLAPMLDAGDLSWSMRLVAGADLAGADSRAVTPEAALAAQASATDPTPGSLVLSDAHKLGSPVPGEDISFIRTGTGSLELLAGGNFSEDSAFGVYTAGTQAAGAPNAAGHYFTTGGGDVLLAAGGNVGGYIFETAAFTSSDQMSVWLQHDSASWWLNFASYTKLNGVTGFTGIGALAGGNVTVMAGADAGTGLGISKTTTTGLQIVDTTTGYKTAGGAVSVFGGGDVSLTAGQAFNPGTNIPGSISSDDAFGLISDLRGSLSLSAATVGQVLPQYSPVAADPRAFDPFVAESAFFTAGPVLVLGDTAASLDARGDLALSGAGGEANAPTKQPSFNFGFSFYQPTSSLALFSAGGNVAPIGDNPGSNDPVFSVDSAAYLTMYYPAQLDVTAASGNIYLLGKNGAIDNLELAPSSRGSLALLAGGSIFDGQGVATSPLNSSPEPLRIEASGAAVSVSSELPSAIIAGGIAHNNPNIVDSATGTLHAGGDETLFYALTGDIVGLETGAVTTTEARSGTPAYIGATAVQIEAGRDVVATGGVSYLSSSNGSQTPAGTPPDLFLDNSATDFSVVQAGRDIIYANVNVAGPGSLLVEAGRNVYQGDQGVLDSVGEIGAALTAATRDSGAGITVLAGLNGGTDLAGFAKLYLDPANLANPTTPLQDQKGKVARTYQTQLLAWLQARGYTGSGAGALAYFLTLSEAEQTTFLLTVYFAELNQSGLDTNNPASRFYHSYLEGQDAIHALFPNTDASGRSPPAGGNLTLFSGEVSGRNGSGLFTNLYDSAIRTNFGGGITTLVPYGQTLLGNYGIVPQPSAGVLTQGSGDIEMYSYGSVTLGQSRVLTTFGGNILIWMSSDGEINAGRGAKNTILVPPVGISYDGYGNIQLSPTTPSAGAGIATLAPIPSVPAGSINLVAPFGTIDAGEAGIRSSGNVNVAALTVVNGANIASGGKTTGVPTVSAPSVNAVAAAASAAGAATAAAQTTQPQQAAAEEASIVEVDILAIGSDNPDTRRKGGI